MKGKVTARVAELVIERDGGACVVRVTHPGARPYEQLHHRRARGMGSTNRVESNLAANLISVCADCHAWIESNRTQALSDGWLVGQSRMPAMEPLLYKGQWKLLNDVGDVVAA